MDEYCSELYKDKDATNPMVAEVDKKFELMLTRRTKAYSSSGSVISSWKLGCSR